MPTRSNGAGRLRRPKHLSKVMRALGKLRRDGGNGLGVTPGRHAEHSALGDGVVHRVLAGHALHGKASADSEVDHHGQHLGRFTELPPSQTKAK